MAAGDHVTAGGNVCHRAELGHWLIPELNLRRSHMTSLWEPAWVGGGGDRNWEGEGSDFRIQAENTKYISESQADTHHMTPLALPMQKSGFGHKKCLPPPALCGLWLLRGALRLEQAAGEPAIPPASISQNVSKTRTQNQPPIPALSICSFIC